MVKRTIKVKKSAGKSDHTDVKDLLSYIVDFATQNTKLIVIFAAAAVAVILAGYFTSSYRQGRRERASEMEYYATDLFEQAQAIDLSEDGAIDTEGIEGEKSEVKPLADRLAERNDLLGKSLAKFEELKAEYSGAKIKERALFYIGIVNYEMANYRSAIAAFEECLKQFPLGEYSAFCAANLARTQEQLGEYENATKTYEELFADHKGASGIAPYYLDLAELYKKLKRMDEAKRVYTQVTTLYPGTQWDKEADTALSDMESDGKPKTAGKQALAPGKLPPGFDPSKVQRVTVGTDKEGKRTVKPAGSSAKDGAKKGAKVKSEKAKDGGAGSK
ncbi:tetratricopeptide repeat protein [bacterium]|nr:tetratricopeptide repeat protein [bacterium]